MNCCSSGKSNDRLRMLDGSKYQEAIALACRSQILMIYILIGFPGGFLLIYKKLLIWPSLYLALRLINYPIAGNPR